jgi:NAD(P)-dependent dehydrogenase (short-subunit alcohol dehydrogenase family)
MVDDRRLVVVTGGGSGIGRAAAAAMFGVAQRLAPWLLGGQPPGREAIEV